MLPSLFQPYPWEKKWYKQRVEETISTVKWLHQDTQARNICESHILEYLAIPKSPSLRISLTHLQAWAWSESIDPVWSLWPKSSYLEFGTTDLEKDSR